MNTGTNQISSIVQEKHELEAISKELGLMEIKYLPSPKSHTANISDLTKHATAMLQLYKEYKETGSSKYITEVLELSE